MHALHWKAGTAPFVAAALLWLGPGGVSRAEDHENQMEDAIFQKVNAYRQNHGLGPLKIHPALREAAQQHALRMAKKELMAHTVEGQGDMALAQQLGYTNGWLGTNIAMCPPGYSNDPAQAMVTMWVNDPPHLLNIMGGPAGYNFTETGVGVWRSNSGKYYACQLFGRRMSPASTISITVVNRTTDPLTFRLISGDNATQNHSLAVGGSGSYTVQSNQGWPSILLEARPPRYPVPMGWQIYNGMTFTIFPVVNPNPGGTGLFYGVRASPYP